MADEGDTVLEAIKDAAANNKRLIVEGSGTKASLGRIMSTDEASTLKVSSFKGLGQITNYEPDELVLMAGAATPLKDILAALDAEGQMLAFDPPLGGASHSQAIGTIGGIIGANLSGPRRFTAGAARDYLLGVSAISGRGEAFYSGGRVMKNVSGYDLSKLMTGSFGTLGVMTDLIIKTMPKPETTASLIVMAADGVSAGAAVERIFSSPYGAEAAALITRDAGRNSSNQNLKNMGDKTAAVIRLEGIENSVKARLTAIKDMLQQYGDLFVLDKASSDALQEELREVTLLPLQEDDVLWKISCPPKAGAALLDHVNRWYNGRAFADWGGGLLWLQLTEADDVSGGDAVRALIKECGGHATLFSASASRRQQADVFMPQSEAVLALTKRIKASFDPKAVLNFGKIYKGV